MAEPKLSKTNSGEDMHFSVGAVIRQNGKYLLIDRLKPPFGFAGVAGHIDENEDDPLTALEREVFEESGLTIKKAKLLLEGLYENECRRGVKYHYWYLYECEVDGKTVWNKEETKSIGWYSKEEIAKLALEPIWNERFKELGVI